MPAAPSTPNGAPLPSSPQARASGTGPVVEVSELVVRYGDRSAVDGLSLTASPGEVLTLLGPNGAGKTTTVETLEGYRRPASGHVRVLGLDPSTDHQVLTPRIGVMLQRGGLYPMLGPRRALALFASYYDGPEDVDRLLDLVSLGPVAGTSWRHLSGGEQQRLALALALVGRPEVVFLDEPTAGIDPQGRITVRQVVDDLRRRGVCVLLTTHELDEAERLADRVVIVDRGRAVATGFPAELVAGGAGEAVTFGGPAGLDVASLGTALGATVAEGPPGRYRVSAVPSPALMARLATWLAEHDATLTDLRTGRTLEEVYLTAVSSSARGRGSDEHEEAGGRRREEQAGAPAVRALAAQVRAETYMTLRRGETLLLTVGIPVIFLVFFSTVHVVSTGTAQAVTFFVPGVLALAVMSTAMVSLGIATGFERGYGVLKRLGSTPLGRPRLLGAKIATVLLVEVVQAAVLIPVGYGLGWEPAPGTASGAAVGQALAVALLATVAFGGIGLLLAGVLRAEVNLAVTNGLYLVLLLLGGMVVPLDKLPGPLADVARLLPAAALSDGLHAALGTGTAVPAQAWAVLGVWAVAAPVAGALTFRWE